MLLPMTNSFEPYEKCFFEFDQSFHGETNKKCNENYKS